MPERLLETVPLREKFREAERVVRELSDHLERGFLPKVHEAVQVSGPGKDATDVTDATVRSCVEAALQSHEYTILKMRELERFLDSIERETDRIMSGADAAGTP